MSNTCQSEVVPIYQEDPCKGNKVNTKCIVDENIYAELGLTANSTQEQINQAIYTAFIALKAQIDSL